MTRQRTRYAQVGIGGRARSFYEWIAGDYADSAELVGFCDLNRTRMRYANRVLQERFGHAPAPTYHADAFDRMVAECKPDVVIVTTIDRTHHHYIVRALELGCDVITEKPMTVDAAKCQQILDAVERTGRNLRVTFNYRYSPHASLVRRLLMDGTIGTVTAVHFEWLLDLTHGADYFRRWHRDKRNSGGLLVHKATHHFDLINFWLGSAPELVMALGGLRFYGHENAQQRGVTDFYTRAYGSEAARDDPFALHLDRSETLTEMYLKAEHEDGYHRDRSVFGDGISIEDTMALLVRYDSGALMSYSLTAYAPWEGLRIALTGDRGRLELTVRESSYVNAQGAKSQEGAAKERELRIWPHFAAPYKVEIPDPEGGHGGGHSGADPLLAADLFGPPKPDPLRRAASHVDGAMSILTGIAGNLSMETGGPVHPQRLVRWPAGSRVT